MADTKKILRNTFFMYSRTIVSLFVSIFTTRFLLEALGASDYGLYNVLGGAIALLGFFTTSLSGSTQRFLSYAEGKNDLKLTETYLINSLLLHNLLSLIMIVIFAGAYFIFFNGILNIPSGKEYDATAIYICMVISVVLSINVVPYNAAMFAHEDMHTTAIIGILDIVAKLLIAIVILYLPFQKLIIYAILMVIESIIIRAITVIYCKHKYPECKELKYKGNINKPILKELSMFAGWQSVSTITSMIGLFGMSIVVNHFFGTTVNAAMAIAIQIQGVMMGVSFNLMKAMAPQMIKSESTGNRKQLLDFTYEGCKFGFMIFTFLALPILANINPVLSFWLNDVPEFTALFCIIIVVSTIIEQTTGIIHQSITAQGDIKRYSICLTIINCPHIIISLVMFSIGGFPPYWISINWLIWRIIPVSIVKLYFAHRNIGLKLSYWMSKSVVPVIIGGAIMFLLSKIASVSFMGIHVIYTLMGCFICAIPVYYVIVLNNRERSLIKNIFRQFYNKHS